MWWIILILCIQGCVWGIATDQVLKNKGYNESWFWWGFFFSFLALIVALTKPEQHKYKYKESESESEWKILAHGGWICGCGRTNPNYTGTCACGAPKERSVNSKAALPASAAVKQAELERLKIEENKILQKGGWKCRRCGKVNPEFIGFCACGMTKGQSKEVDQRYEREENEKRAAAEEMQKNTIDENGSGEKDKFEEIKKYKELLDSGIISEEEFNKKKTELLGL